MRRKQKPPAQDKRNSPITRYCFLKMFRYVWFRKNCCSLSLLANHFSQCQGCPARTFTTCYESIGCLDVREQHDFYPVSVYMECYVVKDNVSSVTMRWICLFIKSITPQQHTVVGRGIYGSKSISGLDLRSLASAKCTPDFRSKEKKLLQRLTQQTFAFRFQEWRVMACTSGIVWRFKEPVDGTFSSARSRPIIKTKYFDLVVDTASDCYQRNTISKQLLTFLFLGKNMGFACY